MNEPYETVGKFAPIVAILCLILGWWFGGPAVGILTFFVVLGAFHFFSLLMDSARWRANCRITINGLGTFSALSLQALNHTADDPKTQMPGKLLFGFGGGGPKWGWAWRDGGKSYASGGYIEVPNDCTILISPDHLWLPVVPMSLKSGLENMSPHFQATIEEKGYNTLYSQFYTADLSLQSLVPPSDKALDMEALKQMKNTLISEGRKVVADQTGHLVSQLDLIRKSIAAVEPKKGLNPFRKNKTEAQPQEQETERAD